MSYEMNNGIKLKFVHITIKTHTDRHTCVRRQFDRLCVGKQQSSRGRSSWVKWLSVCVQDVLLVSVVSLR